MLKYKNYTLIKPDTKQENQILQVINDYNGSVFQEIDLNRIVEKEFNTELFYLVDNPNNISNLSPVHIQKGKFGLKRYHFKPLHDIPYAGFVKDELINYDKFSVGFFDSLNYCGLPIINNNNNTNSSSQKGETCMIDLSLNAEDIFSNVIHSKRRNMIRKAQKSGISVKAFFSSEGLTHFWPILNELHQKLGYTHLKEHYYKALIDHYGPKKQAAILVAFKDEKPISGIFIIGNKNSMLYYKGASAFNVKNEGQGELLQWEAIQLAKELQIKYYDLGNLQKEILPAIYRFKTGISNNIIEYPIYTKNSLGYKVIKKITKT